MDELDAMRAIHEALDGLDDDQRGRALRWAADLFKINLADAPTVVAQNVASADEGPRVYPDAVDGEGVNEIEGARDNNGTSGFGTPQFVHFAELYDACGPKSDTERALVGAYWMQVVQNGSQFTGFDVNKELRNLGHELSNVSRSLSSCMNKKPALILQLRKNGKAKQARKTYKLSHEGVKAVQAMMS